MVLIPSREQQEMETTSFQAAWVLDTSKTQTNEGRRWMGGRAVLGQGWDFVPLFLLKLVFWCGFYIIRS